MLFCRGLIILIFFACTSISFGQRYGVKKLSLQDIDLFAQECICEQLRTTDSELNTSLDEFIQNSLCPQDTINTENQSHEDIHHPTPSSSQNYNNFSNPIISETPYQQIKRVYFNDSLETSYINNDNLIQRIHELLNYCIS